MKISETIKQRLKEAGVNFRANDNISEHITTDELKLLQDEVQEKMQGVLESLVIDTTNDHNTQDTAKRPNNSAPRARQYQNTKSKYEIFKPPTLSISPNTTNPNL